MNAPTVAKPGAVVLVGVAMGVGIAGSLMLLGYSVGQLVPANSASSGWFDTRELNRFLASIAFSCFGVVVGGVGGYLLGCKLAMKDLRTAIPIASMCFVLPFAIGFALKIRADQERLALLAANEERSQQETIWQGQQQNLWLSSTQYAEMVEQQVAELEIFKVAMAPITYSHSELVSSPNPKTLIFETADSIDAVEAFFKSAPVTMGYFSKRGLRYGNVYWTVGDKKGSIYIRTNKTGTELTYSIE